MASLQHHTLMMTTEQVVSAYNGNSVSYQYNLANKLKVITNKKGTTTLSQYSYNYYLDGNQRKRLTIPAR